jgi:hypothetical protein
VAQHPVAADAEGRHVPKVLKNIAFMSVRHLEARELKPFLKNYVLKI